jgi:hypothetical protein
MNLLHDFRACVMRRKTAAVLFAMVILRFEKLCFDFDGYLVVGRNGNI